MEINNNTYIDVINMKNFYNGKNVLITGHTGFKGAWMSELLLNWGANVSGFSIDPPTEINLFSLLDLDERMDSYKVDIRNFNVLEEKFNEVDPEIVIHLAAQPIVLEGYKNPLLTYETNTLGTVNICECIRKSDSVKSFINVTTDKVYENVNKLEGYLEDEKLNGYDPYSNSKSCSDLITQSYFKSFFKDLGIAASTARSGNVMGGGDFAEDRIIPDCVRAALSHEDIIMRNPHSIRPYQFILDALNAYLMIIKKQYEDISYASSYNVGPTDDKCSRTGDLVDIFCEKWGDGLKWTLHESAETDPFESPVLINDSTKLKERINWEPKYDMNTTIEKIVEWTKVYASGEDIIACVNKQINEFFI
jgi:CDP-glucose 4,6-dehydratase